ncbi:hypothetical protein Tco_1052410 [Tanacetum coccineum]
MPGINNTRDGICCNNNSPINNTHELKIGDKFLKILRDNAFNGMDRGDVIDHIARIVKITEWIKIPDINKNRLRVHVFSKSLSNDAKKWRNDEIEGTAISWDELKEKFFHKYYPLSKTCNSETPDDLDNGTDYFEFLYWLASKFDNYWEIDKTTRCGLWEFYVNERTKGMIGDLHDEPRNENSHITYSEWFYKPHLDTHDSDEIYEIIDKEGSLILGPAHHNICNQDELCKTEEFTVVRYSMGLDKEFVAVEPSKISTVKRTTGSMSCIYHNLFDKRNHRWTVTRTK